VKIIAEFENHLSELDGTLKVLGNVSLEVVHAVLVLSVKPVINTD
jgi:hypothetical protein